MCLGGLRGLNFEPCNDLKGFILRDSKTKKAMYTAYVAENGFSTYVAIDDGRGYDLADELPLAIKAPLFTAVAKIKAHHKKIAPEIYCDAMGWDEAYRNGIYD